MQVFIIKQGSLYISPRKLSTAGVPPQDFGGGLHKRKAGQILKAGGVDSGDLSGSRSNLLEAIRKGIQLRKVTYTLFTSTPTYQLQLACLTYLIHCSL